MTSMADLAKSVKVAVAQTAPELGAKGISLFLIDTKTNRYRFLDLAIARRRAKWLSEKLEGHWVTPVICLANGKRAPYEHQRVWVVGVDELVEWIEARRDRPVDPVFALRVLGER